MGGLPTGWNMTMSPTSYLHKGYYYGVIREGREGGIEGGGGEGEGGGGGDGDGGGRES